MMMKNYMTAMLLFMSAAMTVLAGWSILRQRKDPKADMKEDMRHLFQDYQHKMGDVYQKVTGKIIDLKKAV